MALSSGTARQLSAIADAVDKKLKGRRVLPARIVEVVAFERRHPVSQDVHEATVGDVGLGHFRWDAADAVTGKGRGEDVGCAVEGQLPVDADVEPLAVFFEFPGVEAAIGHEPQVDAIVGGEVVWG